MPTLDRVTIPSLAPIAAGERVPSRVRANTGWLGQLETSVVDLIDGSHTVESIAHGVSLSVPEVTAIVRTLEELGVVRFVEIVEVEDEDAIRCNQERPTLPNPIYDRPTLAAHEVTGSGRLSPR